MVWLAVLYRLSVLIVTSNFGRRLLVENRSRDEGCSVLIQRLLLLINEVIEVDLKATHIQQTIRLPILVPVTPHYIRQVLKPVA